MIPTFIGDLKHLRCLTINSYRLDNVHLPRNFDKLDHLQTLELRYECVFNSSNVKNMGHLISLRRVINSRYHLFSPSKVSCFRGAGEMKSLRELSDFRVRKEEGYELQQLERLNHLCGSLRISGLENVESKERALEAKLCDKYLTTLSLAWSQTSSQQPHLFFLWNSTARP
jgi:hypothetical protein